MVQLPAGIANRLDLPTCAKCERRFDHEDYTELGNMIAGTSVMASAVAGVYYALGPYIYVTEASTYSLSTALKKIGRENLAEKVGEYNALNQAVDHLDEFIGPQWESVQWTEKGGEPICYKCK